MLKSISIGMPRIGQNAELLTEIENYKKGISNQNALKEVASRIKKNNWNVQKKANIDYIPVNDFSYGCHVLDMSCLLGNIHKRYFWEGGNVPFSIYFSMMNGSRQNKFETPPLELQNWFNTNYLYLVPDLTDNLEFTYSSNKPILEYFESQEHNIANPVITLIGPSTYLSLLKISEQSITYEEIETEMLSVFEDFFVNLHRIGASCVQIEEHIFSQPLSREMRLTSSSMYQKIRRMAGDKIKICLICSYGSIKENIDFISSLDIDILHFDIKYNDKYEEYFSKFNRKISFSLGVVDADSVLINDLRKSINIVSKVADKIGIERVLIGPSSSLFLLPFDKKSVNKIDAEISLYLSFAKNKLDELSIIKKAINNGVKSVESDLENNQELISKNPFNKNQNDINNLKKDLLSFKENSYIYERNMRAVEFKKEYSLPIIPSSICGFINSSSILYSNKSSSEKKIDEEGSSILLNLQDKYLDIVSSVDTEHENSFIRLAKSLNGVMILENCYSQVAWNTAVNPVLIYDTISLKSLDKFKKIINQSSNVKNPFKINICGPISFVNQCYVLNFDDSCNTNSEYLFDLYKIVSFFIIKIIKLISESKTAIIQFDEQKLLNHLPNDLNNNISYIIKIKEIYDHLLSYIPDNKKSALYICNFYLNNTIEDLARINFDCIFVESANSFNEILSTFKVYKYPGLIGIGIYNDFYSKVLTKEEVFLSIKEKSVLIDESYFVVTTDYHLNLKLLTVEALRGILDAIKNGLESYRAAILSNRMANDK